MTEELSKGFTGIEVNGVRFSNIKEMLIYMDKQRKRIAELEQRNAELQLKLDALEGQMPWKDIKDKSEVIGKLTKAKEIIKKLYSHVFQGIDFMELNDYNVQKAEAEQFLRGELDNTDEYARQRAEDFLKENK